MTSSRLIFLDVDGTYADHSYVPSAHTEAVRAARARGHQVFLCTGRARCMVPESILEAGFDGIVTGAGARAEWGSEVLSNETFPPDEAARLLAVLSAHHAIFMAEGSDALYADQLSHDLIDAQFASLDESAQRVHRDIADVLNTVDSFEGLSFAKIVTLRADVPASQMADEAGLGISAVETSLRELGTGAGEFYLTHVDKAVGIRAIVERLGATPDDVVAAGDGANDIEMLEYAGTAVGIIGGNDGALAVADFAVPGPEHAGLVEAFERIGLI